VGQRTSLFPAKGSFVLAQSRSHKRNFIRRAIVVALPPQTKTKSKAEFCLSTAGNSGAHLFFLANLSARPLHLSARALVPFPNL
jgi:hypothetical protein